MAKISNGRRCGVKPDYDRAAGDFQSDMKLDLMMTERESIVCGSSKSLSKVFGLKEMIALTIITICIYLINGEYSNILCTLFTSIPPAMFSYRVLTNSKTTKNGYHSILFYWTLYGIFTLIDQFAADAQGYCLCKSAILGAIFVHAIRSNAQVWKTFTNITNQLAESVLTQYDSNGFVRKTSSSNFVCRTPTMTEFTDESEDDDSEYMMDYLAENDGQQVKEFDFIAENLDVETAQSFLPSLEMQTTQQFSPDTLLAEKSTIITAREVVKSEANKFFSMSAMTVSALNGPKDIITIPSDRITFSRLVDEVAIRVTNISHLHIMYALKTNADTHLIAAPTTGFLASGQSISIRVGVTNRFFETNSNYGRIIDKLAIDYVLIPQSMSKIISQFSNDFFSTNQRKRNAIKVFYQ